MPRPKNSSFNNTPRGALRQPPKAAEIKESSWLNRPREGFTKAMEKEHLPRMRNSKEGQIGRMSTGGGGGTFT